MALCVAGTRGEDVDTLVAEQAGARCTVDGGKTALMFAAEYGRLALVLALAPLEARIQTDSGATALMHAAAAGHTECVRELASHEMGMVNSDAETALVYAAYYGHHEAASVLLPEAGAHNAHGGFALCYAIEMNWPLVVHILLPAEGHMAVCHDPPCGLRNLVKRWELDPTVYKDPVSQREQLDRHALVHELVEEYLSK